MKVARSIKKDSLVDDNASNITYSDGWETSQISWSQYFWGKTMQYVSPGHGCLVLELTRGTVAGLPEPIFKLTSISGVKLHLSSPGVQRSNGKKGNSITLFGATSNNHKTYTISLDGGPPQTFNGYSLRYNAQAMLVRYLSTTRSFSLTQTSIIVPCE